MSLNLIYKIYNDKRTVFSLQEIAMLVDEPDFNKLKQRINYYVRTNKIKNPRRSIYAKEDYSVEELADNKMKIFVRQEMKTETLQLLKMYQEFPIFE